MWGTMRRVWLASLGCLLGGGAAPALAAGTTSPAKASTLSPLAIVSTQDLDFGTILPGATAGTVTINPNSGNRTFAGSVTAAGGTPQRAEFIGVGQRNVVGVATLGPNPTLTNGAGGSMAATLTMGAGGAGNFVFPGTGIQNFRVGGTLSVGANQPDGIYSGSFTLTIVYF